MIAWAEVPGGHRVHPRSIALAMSSVKQTSDVQMRFTYHDDTKTYNVCKGASGTDGGPD